MNYIKLALSGILTSLTVNGFIEREMNNPNTTTIKPIDSVSIIVPSLNEERYIKKSLQSIRGQSIINEYEEFFEILLVDSGSTDNTIQIAEPFIDKIIEVPVRGKLTARNIATRQAKGNIIVSVDSDTYYPPFWLNNLLEPFNDISNPKYQYTSKHQSITPIAGVVGSTYDPDIPGVPIIIRNFAEVYDRKVLHPNQMIGRNSAFWKHNFYLTGGFDEINTNQFSVNDMVHEEEQSFGNRLSTLGKIVFKLNANCVHLGGAKIGCRWGTTPDKELCNNYKFNIERFGLAK